MPDEKEAPAKGAPSVLFVCTANICRSPMAAALFLSRLKTWRNNWQEWRVESAGTWAADGNPAARGSTQVMAQRGLDIRAHRARSVTLDMLEGFNLILTMEEGHKESLCVEFPSVARKVFLLGEMVGLNEQIDDPYGGPLDGYELTAQRMERIIANGMPRILALAEKSA